MLRFVVLGSKGNHYNVTLAGGCRQGRQHCGEGNASSCQDVARAPLLLLLLKADESPPRAPSSHSNL